MDWYLRDASWYNKPETKTPKQVHLLRDGDDLALCNKYIALDVDIPYDDPPEFRKCKNCIRKFNHKQGVE